MSDFPHDPQSDNPNQAPTPPGDHEPACQDALFELMDLVESRVREHCTPVESDELRVYDGTFLTEDGALLDLSWSTEILPKHVRDRATPGELILRGIVNDGQCATISKREPQNSQEDLETIFVLGSVDGAIDPYKSIAIVNPLEEEEFLRRIAEMPADIRESFLQRGFFKQLSAEEAEEAEELFQLNQATGSNDITEGEARDMCEQVQTAVFLPPL